jgi:hypothetical protein
MALKEGAFAGSTFLIEPDGDLSWLDEIRLIYWPSLGVQGQGLQPY